MMIESFFLTIAVGSLFCLSAIFVYAVFCFFGIKGSIMLFLIFVAFSVVWFMFYKEMTKNDSKPYSNAEEKEARLIGLNLDDWEDYKEYFSLDEYADREC